MGNSFNDFVSKKIKANLDNSEINPRDLKRDLARKIIELFYNRQSAVKGEKYIDKIFIKKGVPEDIVNISIKEKTLLIDCLLENNLVKSKSEGRRLIKQNAVKINDKTCPDIHYQIIPDNEYTVKVGKRRFIKFS